MGLLDDVREAVAELFDENEGPSVSITYIPATGTEPFGCQAIRSRINLDTSFGRDTSDTQELKIFHSALLAQGIAAPAKRHGSASGDTLRALDIDGVAEDWVVVEADPNPATGEWKLTVVRNERAKV